MPRKGYKKPNPYTRRIAIRCTDEEFEAISNRAHACGLTMSDYLRDLAHWHVNEKRVEQAPKARMGRLKEEQLAKLFPLLTELSRNGNNLNQLARQANTGIVPVARSDLDGALGRLNEILDDMRAIIEPSLR